jgi:hypothetical protein
MHHTGESVHDNSNATPKHHHCSPHNTPGVLCTAIWYLRAALACSTAASRQLVGSKQLMHAQLQEKRQTAKAEKLDKIRKGEKAVDEKHRTAEQKKASKDFYKQVRACTLTCRMSVCHKKHFVVPSLDNMHMLWSIVS